MGGSIIYGQQMCASEMMRYQAKPAMSSILSDLAASKEAFVEWSSQRPESRVGSGLFFLTQFGFRAFISGPVRFDIIISSGLFGSKIFTMFLD